MKESVCEIQRKKNPRDGTPYLIETYTHTWQVRRVQSTEGTIQARVAVSDSPDQ